MWGISPHVDLLSGVSPDAYDAVNILLICPSDPRSAIATIAEARAKRINESADASSNHTKLRFYIVEESLEVLARHFLLLHIFYDEKLPIRQRASLYLEVLSNSLVQEKTATYLEEKGKFLVDFVLDGKSSCMENIFDLSLLKQIELDGLADVFASWKRSNESNLKEMRDGILRNFYADRYDCREGVIDWDYQIQIKPYASIIHPIQFREWRLNGIAFEFGGASYVSDNWSLVNLDQSNRFSRRHTPANLKMDVVTGPFISHGVTCDRSDSFADGLFEIHNKGTGAAQHRYSATDVALYNITSWMWQASTGRKYQMKLKGDVLSGLGVDESDLPHPENDDNQANPDKAEVIIIPVRDARKIFNKKFKQCFDCVFVSNSASSILKCSDLYDQMKKDATIVVETCQLDLTKSASYKEGSIKKIRNIMSEKNAIETNNGSNGFDDTLLTFKFGE